MAEKRARIVPLDLPTSWQMTTASADGIPARMAKAIDAMTFDMLAAVTGRNCDDRRGRKAQGIAKAKASGVYRGRPENAERKAVIVSMLAKGQSWSSIQKATALRPASSRSRNGHR